MFLDPPVYIPAVYAADLFAEPSIFVFHNSNIISDQFSPVAQLLQLIRTQLAGVRVLRKQTLHRDAGSSLFNRGFFGGRLLRDNGVRFFLDNSRGLGPLLFSIIFYIENSHNFISKVVLIYKLYDLLLDCRHLSNFEYARSLIVIFIQK